MKKLFIMMDNEKRWDGLVHFYPDCEKGEGSLFTLPTTLEGQVISALEEGECHLCHHCEERLTGGKRYPFLVYGTLRHGNGNYRRFLDGLTVSEDIGVTLKGYDMYNLGAFPFAVEGEGAIVGDLMYVHPKQYVFALDALDHLEGYDAEKPASSMYLRKLVDVTTSDGEQVQAWLYVWAREGDVTKYRKIEDGNWNNATPVRRWSGYVAGHLS